VIGEYLTAAAPELTPTPAAAGFLNGSTPTRCLMSRSSFKLLTPLASLILLAGCASNTSNQAPAPDKASAFWPPFPDSPHIQYLTSFAVSDDVQAKRGKLEEIMYGKDEERALILNKPYGVKMHEGKIFVCDTSHNALVTLDLRKREVRMIGVAGEGKLVKPIDVAIASDGNKYVADSQRPAVYVFDKNDKFLRLIGAKDFRPVSVAVRGDELYAADFKNHRVIVWNRHNGQQLRTIGKPGLEKGQLAGPLGLALDAEGNLYVSEIVTCRISKFAPDGKFLKAFGNRGDQVGTFTRPKHLDIDADGNLYVVDAAFQNVQMFNNAFKPLMAFGGHGNFPGYMDLPAGIDIHDGDLDLFQQYVHPAFQAQRLVLVTNQWGDNRVAVYALGKLKDGKTTNDIAASRTIVPQDWAGGETAPGERPAASPVDINEVPKDLKHE
jgi:DNA-binding beta-propeller fold protein YncE